MNCVGKQMHDLDSWPGISQRENAYNHHAKVAPSKQNAKYQSDIFPSEFNRIQNIFVLGAKNER